MTLAFDLTANASPAGGQRGNATFEFRAGPFIQGELTVLSFTGREGLSQLFSFDILFASTTNSRELEAGLVGQPATLVFRVDGSAPRLIHGIVSWLQVEETWASHDSVREYRARLVPALWRLKQRVNSRIFQDKTIPEVITTVLREARIPVRFGLSRAVYPLTYCVQYEESDFDFITRLLAEQSWYYYFEPPSGLLDTLGLGDLSGAVDAVSEILGGAAGNAAASLTECLVVGDAATFYPAMASLGSGFEAMAESAAQLAGGAIASAAGFGTMEAMVAQSLQPVPALVFRKPAGMSIEDERTVPQFALRRTLRSTSVTLRDYLYEHPLLDATGRAGVLPQNLGDVAGAALSVAVGAVSGAMSGEGASVLASAAADALPLPADGLPREVYRHQMDYLFRNDARDPRAREELEQHRSRAWRAQGASFCRRLTTGYRFALQEHSDNRLNRTYVVTRVKHRGATVEGLTAQGKDPERVRTYENTFECAPATVTVRPKRPPPRAVQVADTAVVVGPAGEEIYTDTMGRIKVQFHWDRLGKKNEHSSCWLRVMHNWSGSGWGTQFIPRIGMEVLVLYQQGDPDKPMVIGCAPNAVTPQPFWLPHDATRNGLRTNSSPGGGGFNELSFEDQKDHEQIYLRAQKNLDEVVLHDHTLVVHHDERIRVVNDRTHAVEGNHRETVEGHHNDAVTGDKTATVGGVRNSSVGGNAVDAVGGIENRHVSGPASFATDGNYTMVVGGSSVTVVGTEQDPKEVHASTYGKHNVFASDEILVQSEKKITLRCGDSEIVMSPDTVTVTSKTIVVDGRESTTLFGKKPSLKLTDVTELASDKITLTSQSASLELDSNATLLGSKVNLGSGASGSTTTRNTPAAEMKPFATQLCDSEHKPYANKPYNLNVGGMRFSGSTDGQGFVRVQVPKAATAADLRLWLTPPPTGHYLRWAVRIEDQLNPASDVRGAQMRLFNMGYFHGDPDGHLSETLTAAVRAFQHDHDIPTTGDLDGRTTGALTSKHGT